jgi:hypothetical protein
MAYIPRNASPERIAQDIGNFNADNVLTFLNNKRPSHGYTMETLQAIAQAHPEAVMRGKQMNKKRYAGNGHDNQVETLQESTVKQDCRRIFIDALDRAYGDKSPSQPLRLLTLPGTQFKTELMLLEHPRLKTKIQEILALEGIASVIPKVEAKAREISTLYPDTQITVIPDRDTELTSTWRAELNPEAGVNALWLDNMASWNQGNEKTLIDILSMPWMFKRAWKEGVPAYLFLTLRAQQERNIAKDVLTLAQQQCAQVVADSSLTNPENQTHQWRIQGLAAFMFSEGLKHGVLCKPMIQYIYRHTSGKGTTMLLNGFEITPLTDTPTAPFVVEVERLQPQ